MKENAKVFFGITMISFILGVYLLLRLSRGEIFAYEQSNDAIIIYCFFALALLFHGYAMHLLTLGKEKDWNLIKYGIEIILVGHLYVENKPVSSQIQILKSGKKIFVSGNKELLKLPEGAHFTKLRNGGIIKKATI